MSIEIEFRHRFRGFDLDISLHARDATFTALFGPSGAGKTSILNAVAGLLRPDEGRIVIGGHILFDSASGIWVPPEQRRIGYLFQESRLFPHLNVETNLRFGWRRAAHPCPETEIVRVTEMLNLQGLLKRKPKALSGGEKARVALGRALLADPKILLLDEPLVALDTARRNEILPYLERLRDQARVPILYVSHALEEVARLADEIAILKMGRVVASGALFEVLTDLHLPDMTGDPPYGAVFITTVLRNFVPDGLTLLSFAGGELRVPLLPQQPGARLRTHVRAADVMIALEEPRGISANNVLPATISEVRKGADAHADVRLLCGDTPFVARITRASCERLALIAGAKVFAIVKSVSVVPQANG